MSEVTQTPTRRSGRGRVPNRKYEEESLAILKDVLSSDSDEAVQIVHNEARAARRRGDDDFEVANAAEISSDSEASSNHSAQSSDIHTPVEEDSDDAQSYDDGSGHEKGKTVKFSVVPANREPKRSTPSKRKIPEVAVRSRGIVENPISRFRKSSRVVPLAGPASEDQLPVLESIQHWGEEPTLPLKRKLRHPFTMGEGKRRLEATKGWDWYYDEGGGDALTSRQKVSQINDAQKSDYLPRPTSGSRDVLLGPYGKQKRFHFALNEAKALGGAWQDAVRDHDGGEVGARSHGWLLNVGARVQSIDWAPNQGDGHQYLAITTTSNSRYRLNSTQAPAFNPAPPSKSAIQIWRFSPSAANAVDESQPATLVQVLCHEWGNAMQIKWCPMTRQFRSEDFDNYIPLGLLAGVFDDGAARILDLSLPKESIKLPTYCMHGLLPNPRNYQHSDHACSQDLLPCFDTPSASTHHHHHPCLAVPL